jgi:hypothetical protein
MSKEQRAKKDTKKKALLTPKEKKAQKNAKKNGGGMLGLECKIGACRVRCRNNARKEKTYDFCNICGVNSFLM